MRTSRLLLFSLSILMSCQIKTAVKDNDPLEDIRSVTYSDIVTGMSNQFDEVLQCYGEELLRNKMGAIVALNPSTGAILAGVASPDAKMFDRIRPMVKECEDIANGECRDGLVQELWLNVNGPVGSGSKAWIAHVDGLDVCGEARNPENPEGFYHSVFLGFAPKDNPQIAIVVFVENGRYGAAYAAPIASLMIEKYLRRETARPELEKRMKSANLVNRVIYNYQR